MESPIETVRPAEVATDGGLGEDQRRRLRRFTFWISGAMVVGCNVLVFLALWWSGINLDLMIRVPDVFNPKEDICLRLSWLQVSGSDQLVRICNEWIHLADPSGETHRFSQETRVRQAADGTLYFDHGAMVDYRLFGLGAFVALVIGAGLALKRMLIARYRLRLTAAASPHS